MLRIVIPTGVEGPAVSAQATPILKTALAWGTGHYADYSIIYGSLGATIALLVWMYLISLVILIGAEFNAMLFPRAFLGKELKACRPRIPLPSKPRLLGTFSPIDEACCPA